MQLLHFFLGANSEEGFSSLYEQLLGGRFDDLLILKGGAGSGKSTFMRRVGAAVERTGERVVYINCSGDPDSLDGAIFLDRRAAIVDGTAPHGTAPLGHPAKKVSICKALRRRKYYGSSTRHGSNRTLLQDKLFKIRRNCSIKKSSFPKSEVSTGKSRTFPKWALIFRQTRKIPYH